MTSPHLQTDRQTDRQCFSCQVVQLNGTMYIRIYCRPWKIAKNIKTSRAGELTGHVPYATWFVLPIDEDKVDGNAARNDGQADCCKNEENTIRSSTRVAISRKWRNFVETETVA